MSTTVDERGERPGDQPVTVFVVDDHEMVRAGIAALLESADGIDLVGEAESAEVALGRIALAAPDVALVDINLPGMSGIELCRALHEQCREVAVIILTSYAEDEALFDSVLAGAAGFVLKHVKGMRLAECVRQAARGESLTDPTAAEHVRARVRDAGDSDPLLAELTAKEREVLRYLADGKTNREIAAEMFLSDKTVKNYVSNVLGKLGMKRRSEAAALEARIAERRRVFEVSANDEPSVRY